jgi:hypothetical protein
MPIVWDGGFETCPLGQNDCSEEYHQWDTQEGYYAPPHAPFTELYPYVESTTKAAVGGKGRGVRMPVPASNVIANYTSDSHGAPKKARSEAESGYSWTTPGGSAGPELWYGLAYKFSGFTDWSGYTNGAYSFWIICQPARNHDTNGPLGVAMQVNSSGTPTFSLGRSHGAVDAGYFPDGLGSDRIAWDPGDVNDLWTYWVFHVKYGDPPYALREVWQWNEGQPTPALSGGQRGVKTSKNYTTTTGTNHYLAGWYTGYQPTWGSGRTIYMDNLKIANPGSGETKAQLFAMVDPSGGVSPPGLPSKPLNVKTTVGAY